MSDIANTLLPALSATGRFPCPEEGCAHGQGGKKGPLRNLGNLKTHHATVHPVTRGFACTECALTVAHNKRNFPDQQRLNKHDAQAQPSGNFVCTCNRQYPNLVHANPQVTG